MMTPLKHSNALLLKVNFPNTGQGNKFLIRGHDIFYLSCAGILSSNVLYALYNSCAEP